MLFKSNKINLHSRKTLFSVVSLNIKVNYYRDLFLNLKEKILTVCKLVFYNILNNERFYIAIFYYLFTLLLKVTKNIYLLCFTFVRQRPHSGTGSP